MKPTFKNLGNLFALLVALEFVVFAAGSYADVHSRHRYIPAESPVKVHVSFEKFVNKKLSKYNPEKSPQSQAKNMQELYPEEFASNTQQVNLWK